MQLLLEGLPLLFNNPKAKIILGEATNLAIERANAGWRERYDVLVRVGISRPPRAPVPAVDSGEIHRRHYSHWSESHYRTHWLMLRAYKECVEEAVRALEYAREGFVAELQSVHEFQTVN